MKHSEEHYRLFFGSKADYYWDILKDFEEGKSMAFNIFAFLFGFFWLLYRKMFIHVLVILAIILAEVIIEGYIYTWFNVTTETQTLIDYLSTIIWAVVLGAFSNGFYIQQANRKITKILTLQLDDEETNKRIIKAGGTTLIPHIIILSVAAIVIFLQMG